MFFHHRFINQSVLTIIPAVFFGAGPAGEGMALTYAPGVSAGGNAAHLAPEVHRAFAAAAQQGASGQSLFVHIPIYNPHVKYISDASLLPYGKADVWAAGVLL